MRMISLLFLVACGEEVLKIEEPAEGEIQVDSDGDGFFAGEDCDDSNSTINPNAEEVCDGLDNDCDELADEDVQSSFYADSDNDGFGSSSIIIEACEVPNGFVTNGSDCDDTEPTAFPGGEEVCDNIDNDCNGQVDDNLGQSFYVDLDGDGYGNPDQLQEACFLDFGLSTLAGDCDDQNPSINPGEEELCNEIDDNCDGNMDEDVALPFYADFDGDEYGDGENILYACSLPNGYVQNTLDCNDADSQINPAGDEYCDTVDNDCDGEIDEISAINGDYFYEDNDNDGYGNAGSVISACSLPDGYVIDNQDCDDNNNDVYPTSTEVCNGKDDDCDGVIDEEVGTIGTIMYYPDTDGDGFGHQDGSDFCTQPVGYVLSNTDCDDNDNDIYPSSVELCNGEDDDCDGEIDEGVLQPYYIDVDDDGFGVLDEETQTEACSMPTGFSELSTDCDDTAPNNFPGNEEVCDGIDNNCNQSIDDGVGDIFFADTDNDTFGDFDVEEQSCEKPDGYVDNSEDCDDSNDEISPNATEICNAIDDNCNGFVDEGENIPFVIYYQDSDEDGYGDPEASATFCSTPEGYVTNNLDCDDNDDDVNPNGIEICNGEDDDCDTQIDINATNGPTWYADADGDGFGDLSNMESACNAPDGYVSNASDCNDDATTGALLNPNVEEICDGIDNDCNGQIDDDPISGLSTWYRDLDGDLFGTPTSTVESCDKPSGYVSDSSDCNDLDITINPNATELCDLLNIDENCNDLVDDDDSEVEGRLTYYIDNDDDTFGDESDVGTLYCDPPVGYVLSNSDCDDAEKDVYPNATEVCDDIDADCDGDLVDDLENDCHEQATCADDGTIYTCICDELYEGDGFDECKLDLFPNSNILSSDDKIQLNTWSASPNTEWQLCFQKTSDGASSYTWHSLCDTYNITYTVLKLSTGVVIGGYSTTQWTGGGNYTGSSSNYLFSLTQGYKIQHCTGQHSCSYPQYNAPSYGPTFGAGHDLYVDSSLNGGYCNLGHDYACQVGSYGSSTCQNNFCGNYSSWTVDEMEVWVHAQ